MPNTELEAFLTTLPKDINQKEVAEMYDTYVHFGLTPAQALQSLQNRFTPTTAVKTAASQNGVPKPSTGLTDQRNVILEATITVVYPPKPDANPRGPRATGRLVTHGQEIWFSAFTDVSFKAGDRVRLSGADIGQYREAPQLTLSKGTMVEVLTTPTGPARTVTVKDVTLQDLSPVNLTVRIVNVRKITAPDGRHSHVGLAADASGVVPFFATTKEFPFKAGDVIEIQGGLPRPYKGHVNLNVTEESRVLASQAVLPDTNQLPIYQAIPMSAGKGRRIDFVKLQGRIVDARRDSGVIRRCKQLIDDKANPGAKRTCDIIIREAACKTHGRVQGAPELRVRVILDDGVTTSCVNMSASTVEKLTHTKVADLIQEARSFEDNSLPSRKVMECIGGKRVTVLGDLSDTEDYGMDVWEHDTSLSPALDVRGALASVSLARQGANQEPVMA